MSIIIKVLPNNNCIFKTRYITIFVLYKSFTSIYGNYYSCCILFGILIHHP